jgi:hypothetical protein
LAKYTLTRGRHVPAAARLAAAVTPPSAARWRFAAKLAVWPYRLSLVRVRRYDTLVLDQGPLQSAWCVLLEGSLTKEHVLREAIADLLAGNALDFAFVHVEVAPKLAARRIVARGAIFPPFDRGLRDAERLLRAHRDHLEHVLEVARRLVPAPVLRLDGSAALAANDARIDAFMDALATRSAA